MDTPVVALEINPEVSESRRRFNEAVAAEIEEAVQRKQLELVKAMADAGIPLDEFPNTNEGLAGLRAWMKDHDIAIDRVVNQEDFSQSGTYIKRADMIVGFVPAEIVRGVLI